MKKILVIALSLMSLSTVSMAAEKPSKQCEERATAFVKAVVSITNSKATAKEAAYSVSNYASEEKRDRITIQAFGLNGEDSDTYEEYEVVMFKFSHAPKTCYGLESLTLVGEN